MDENKSAASGTKLKFSAKFRKDPIAITAIALFAAVVISEIVLAVSIPLYMKRENIMIAETNRLEALLAFDYLRVYCNSIPATNRVIQMEKRLLCESLDIFTINLRKAAETLTPEEVARLQKLIKSLGRSAYRLQQGQSFSTDHTLDTSRYINNLLNLSNKGAANAGK